MTQADMDYERLEYIHHVIQECMDDNNDLPMLETALTFIEALREPYLIEKGTQGGVHD